MAAQQHDRRRQTKSANHNAGDSFTSVYVDRAASSEAVQAAVAQMPKPRGVTKVRVDDRSMAGIFGCRIAVDLTGTFDEKIEGPFLARFYAQRLSAALGVPSFALVDLLRNDSTRLPNQGTGPQDDGRNTNPCPI
jgi:hypothetical protein